MSNAQPATPSHARTEALDHLCQKLAALLQPALGTLPTAELSPEGASAAEEEGSVAAVLRFEGALAGECTVRAQADALLQALGADSGAQEAADARVRLEQLLDPVTEALGASLRARYGAVHVQRLEADAPVSSSHQPLAVLRAGELLLHLTADNEFEEALGRLGRAAAAAEASGLLEGNLGLVMDVELEVTLRFGQRQLCLREVLELGPGSVVELESQVDEPVELILDGRVIARGEAVIVDGNYGVRITEVLHPVVA